MGMIIPFRTSGRIAHIDSAHLQFPSPAVPCPEEKGEPLNGGQSSSRRIKEFEEELLQYMDESYLRSNCTVVVSENLKEEEVEGSLPEMAHLKELIVFSPEIQQEGFAKSVTRGEQRDNREWGDVFLKIGDEYPFLFTMYTSDYVKKQFQLYGEKIKPSSKDVILKAKQLGPRNILQAVIKWVNLYAPCVTGRPIYLEDDAILQTLYCDPGIEVSCPVP